MTEALSWGLHLSFSVRECDMHIANKYSPPKPHLIVHDTLTANLIQRVHHVEHLIVLRMKYFLRMSASDASSLIVNVNSCQHLSTTKQKSPSVASSPLPVRSLRHGGLRQWRSRSCLGLPAWLCVEMLAQVIVQQAIPANLIESTVL